MAKVLITDKINDMAVKIVSKTAQVDNLPTMDEDKLCEIIKDYDALLVRSQTKVTAKIIEAGTNLKIIGRAGVGVDNIDVEAATKKGIIVVNSPDGNTHAAAEHTIAMMMTMARNIPDANTSVKKGLWERSKYTGVEVYNKTLGIIGFGKIGSHVAAVAMALGMNVIVYDPWANKEIVEKTGAKYIEHLDDFWGQSDFITIHTPKTKETAGLINTNTLNRMKKGVRIINCARGGIIDESALAKALNEGIVAGCAIDVYEDEKNVDKSPLVTGDFGKNVVLTPHLGASTDEAQINVAVDVAHQVVDVLNGGNAQSAINIPALRPNKLEKVKDYMELAENLAQIASQLSLGAIKEVSISVGGELNNVDVSPLEIAILKGVIESNMTGVNYVNAPIIAKDRGIEIKTSKLNISKNIIEIVIKTSKKETKVVGSLVAKGIKRIVVIDDYITSIEPNKHMLFIPHVNKPSMVAKTASVLGDEQVNISGMQVVQNSKDKDNSTMIINIDKALKDDILNKIKEINGVIDAICINL